MPPNPEPKEPVWPFDYPDGLRKEAHNAMALRRPWDGQVQGSGRTPGLAYPKLAEPEIGR